MKRLDQWMAAHGGGAVWWVIGALVVGWLLANLWAFGVQEG